MSTVLKEQQESTKDSITEQLESSLAPPYGKFADEMLSSLLKIKS